MNAGRGMQLLVLQMDGTNCRRPQGGDSYLSCAGRPQGSPLHFQKPLRVGETFAVSLFPQ